jgi:amino acid adenylation domain-containing protein
MTDSMHRRLAALSTAQRDELARLLASSSSSEVVAYVVPRAGAAPTADELRAWMRTKLPDYMVPAAIEMLEVLPLLPSGKLDRRALPAPVRQRELTAPRTALETAVAGAFASVLALEAVGADDDFFAIGGNSLLAARVVARIREALRIELPVRALFEAPTPAALAARIGGGEARALEHAPLARVPRGDDLPASSAQERLWLLEQLDPGTPSYHVPGCVRLRGALDEAALAAALAEVVRRHEALRTGFVEVGGRVYQRIAEAVEIELLVTHGDLDARISAIVSAPFDLTRPPLLRAELVRRSRSEAALVLCLHHLVCDGWSIGIVIDELVRLYEAFAAGAASPLQPVAWQYVDLCAPAEHGADLAWWRTQLEGAPSTLELPTVHPRPARRSWQGGRVRFEVPRAAALRAACGAAGVTPFMLLLASWQLLLARYARQDDLVIGTPIAGRTRVEAERVVGCFVNTLCLRARIDGAAPVRGWLAQVREVVLEAQAHQGLPFEQLVEALAPARDASRTPLFQACFVFQNTDDPAARRAPAGLTVEPIDVDNGASKFDLTLAVEDVAGGADAFTAAIEYASDLWDAPAVERMAVHLLTIVNGLVDAVARDGGAQPLSSLPTLAGEELTAMTGAAPVTYPVTWRLHERFAEWAQRQPDAIAVSGEGRHLSYGALAVQARRLAVALRRQGVGPEVRVGLLVERSPELVVAVLGILEAGGAYVPVDAAYPRDRIAYILEDAGCSVIVSQASLFDRLPVGLAVVDVQAFEAADASPAHDAGTTLAGGSPEDLAYVIYTSGSTGRPKGCMVTHRHVARLFLATEAWFAPSPHDVWSLFHSIAFDFSVWELWGALLYGGRVVVVPYLTGRNPEELHRLLSDERVTMLSQTPSAFRQLSALGEEVAGHPLSLRTVVFGGEMLDLRALSPWFARHVPGPQLVNMYGITETTVHVTYRPIRREEVANEASVIGEAMSDLALQLRDQHDQLVPRGVPGEIWISGGGVARGYLDRPELTAARFVEREGRRWYRSGDLAVRRRDGELVYLGRIDQQIKIRGFRIELGEIESVVRGLAGVSDAAVIVTERNPGDAVIVAYVVAAAPEGLHAAAAALLPEYMVPVAFVPVAAIPLTSNGKLDRGALPVPVLGRPRTVEAEAPIGDAEQTLAAIWRELLDVETIGRADNFFTLGGDSILAIQMVSAARRAGLAITIKQLFQRQTLAELAAAAGEAVVKTLPSGAGPAPLAPMQRWLFAQDLEHLAHWNQAIRLALSQPPRREALVTAVAAVLARHDALRARFARAADGTWSQQVATAEDPARVVLWTEDLDASAQALQTSLDLANGPVIRIAASERGELLLVAHHLVVDAVSWRLIVGDLVAAVGGAELGPGPSWRAACATLSAREPAPAPEIALATLPLAGAAPDDLEGRAVETTRTIDAAPVLALAVAYAARPEDILLTGLARVLPAETGGPVAVVVEGHGRDDDELAGTVGWLTELTGVVLEGASNDPHRALCEVKEAARAARGRALPDGVEVSLNYLGQTDRGGASLVRLVEGTVGASRHPGARRPFRLELTAEVRAGRLQLTWSHAPAEGAWIARIADAHIAALAELATAPGGRTPSDFPLARLPQARLDLILAGATGAELEDLYPLSPVQHGFLIRALARGGAADLEQARYVLEGPLDVERFAAAWRTVVARHPALRTRFVWDELDAPLQLVQRAAPLEIEVLVLYGQAALDAKILADRARGFSLGTAPLTRVTIVRRADAAEVRHEVIWSHHHLVLDGWSVQRVLADVVAAYQGAPLPAAPRFADWMAWWQASDRMATQAFWRAEFAGLAGPTPLGIDRLPWAIPVTSLPVGEAGHREHVRRLPIEPVRVLASRLGITLGSVIESAWALVLAAASGERDVVFGSTVSGRGVDVAGIEDVVGMLINVVPVRARIDPDEPLAAWLTSRHAAALVRRGHEHAAPADLQAWSGVPMSVPLYDSLVVVENFPVRVHALPGGLTVRDAGGGVASGSKLTLLVAPGAELELVAAHDVRSLDAAAVDALVEDFVAVLAAMGTAGLEPTSVAQALAAGRPRRTPSAEDVRVAGVPVTAAELEALVAAHPAVTSVRVELVGSPPHPVAHVSCAADASIANLRALLRTRLPEPLVPRLLVTGADASAVAFEVSGVVAPRTPIEQVIASVWAELLELPQVGATDDFFDLGGQSVVVVKMLSRLRRAFGIAVPPAVVFEQRTVESIAAWIADRPVVAGASVLSGLAPHAGAAELPPLERLAPRPYYELSPYQLPEFYFAQLAPDSPMYNQLSCDVLLVGQLDRKALVASWQTICERHAVFRTKFAFVDGRPVQVVAPSIAISEAELWLDRTAIPEKDFEIATRALGLEYARTALDFFAGPLFVLKVASYRGERHQIILLTNHVLWDEVSSINLGAEIVEAYNAHRAGRTPRLPPVAVDYVDYTVWVNRCVAEGLFEPHRRYWLETFAAPPAPLELPTDFPRPPHLTFVGSDVSGELPRALVRRLADELPRRFPGVTLSMFLHAVLNALLARLSGADDLVIGVPISNRGHEGLERVMGPFATGMPMRCRVDGDRSFTELLAHTRQVTLEALEHYAYPSVLAIQEINPSWDPSRGRLFSVMYGLQHDKTRYWRELHWDGLETRRLAHVDDIGPLHSTARTDLRLIVEPLGDDIAYSWSYNSDLFRHATVQRFAAQYTDLIAQVLDAPDRAVGDFTLAGTIPAVVGAAVPLPEGDVISQLREHEGIAIIDGDRRISYAELHAAAARWAHELRVAGVEEEGLVALVCEPSAETVIAILAVLMAGAAYLPISPEAPPARQRAIHARAGAPIVLAQRAELAAALDGAPVLAMDRVVARPSTPPPRHVDPARRAVVFFTSGTTGEPKGIEIEHRSIVNLLASTQRATPLHADDAVLMLAPYHFDASLLELLWPLLHGARIVVAPADEARDPAALAARIEREAVTIVQTVPTMLDALVTGRAAGSLPPMATVRHVICGSAPLSRDLRARFAAALSASLANHYGPTEATVDTTRCDAAIEHDGEIVPLGRPLDNVIVEVVDRRGRAVPPGVLGEIRIGGANLARGYFDDPARTADRFIHIEGGHRRYRSGDIGRLLPDGTLGFIGRSDRQVKVRGNRVELDEIEARLGVHPDVASCAVTLHRDALIGYVELRGEVDGLRAFTLAQRPDLAREMTRLHAGAWPEFFNGDEAMTRLWPRLLAERAEYQLVLVDAQDRAVAVGNAAPIRWDGTVAGLPAGWSGALAAAFEPAPADTLVVYAGVAAPEAAGRGLGSSILRALRQLARAHGLARVVVPVRPTGKASRPELSFEAWCALRRDDGLAADDWIRVHERLGARALAVELRSQIVRAEVECWRTWTGAALDRDGEYAIAGALAPVRVTGELAEYADPCLWMEHPLGDAPALVLTDAAAIRAHLRLTLPEYMVPEHVRFLARLPLTAVGKIDLRALPAPATLAERPLPRPPVTEAQQRLASIWRDVLALEEDVGIADDFFELGGHSIRAMQLLARVADSFGVRVPLKQLIVEPTILGLERTLAAAGACLALEPS